MKTEQDYVENAYRRLLALGHRAGWEIGMLGCSTDLIYEQDGNLIAIEYKKRDWRRCIKQARRNAIGVDYTYICMLEKSICDKMLEECRKAGVGIMVSLHNSRMPDLPFRVVVPSAQCQPWAAIREQTSDRLTSPHCVQQSIP